MGCSRQEYWSELPLPSPGDLPAPGIEPTSPASKADSVASEPPGSPMFIKGGGQIQHLLSPGRLSGQAQVKHCRGSPHVLEMEVGVGCKLYVYLLENTYFYPQLSFFLSFFFFLLKNIHNKKPPMGLSGKESACQCKRHRFNPWVGKIP